MKEITVKEILERIPLQVKAGGGVLNNKITDEDYFRPGLQFTGYYGTFSKEKVQIIGKHESEYLHTLTPKEREKAIETYVCLKPPCIVVTRDLDIYEDFIPYCEKERVPLLVTDMKTFELTAKLTRVLEKALAQEKGVHGVCLNVYGVGILLRGESGIGKSEVALSLIERGHRLIADDLVLLKKYGPEALIGTSNGINKDFLALRGVGLINVLRLYGTGSIQHETKINLDIYLSSWDGKKYYDAIHVEERIKEYLGVSVKSMEIPVRPGRDLASLIEVAAKNYKLHQDGYDAVQDFEQRIRNQINEN